MSEAQPLKLSLTSCFGSPRHWERVLDFAQQHGVQRVAYFWDGAYAGMLGPFLYPRYEGLVPDALRPGLEAYHEHLPEVARMTAEAGRELWHIFQVLDLPDVARAREALPQLFNAHGEPDLAGEVFAQLLRDQLDEILALAPTLTGIEMWVMECSNVTVSTLQHQSLSTQEICDRIVDIVRDHLLSKGVGLDVSLHTAGGDPDLRQGLLQAARRYPDVVISGDNTAGDLHLQLPFNEHLVEAARTNPVGVNFDLNGEFWGRNFVPTSALQLLEEHLEHARQLRPAYVNGRVCNAIDVFSPHANVLPSRRQFYPRLADVAPDRPIPPGLEITATDTLGAINGEFFVQRAKDPAVTPEDAVRSFLIREFGEEASDLTQVFLDLQELNGKIFYADKNYYGIISMLPRRIDLEMCQVHRQLTLPEGTPFPPEDVHAGSDGEYTFAFAGWPTPKDHRVAGVESMLRDKVDAVDEAARILTEVRRHTAALAADDREFLIRLFEDLQLFAQAFRWLFEAHAHYYLEQAGMRRGSLPDRDRLQQSIEELTRVRDTWRGRYPGGRYAIAETIEAWVEVFRGKPTEDDFLDCLASIDLLKASAYADASG